ATRVEPLSSQIIQNSDFEAAKSTDNITGELKTENQEPQPVKVLEPTNTSKTNIKGVNK
ncbi:hypothetical protein HHI36_005069, partial [Cryptolaemus montrouzieri]